MRFIAGRVFRVFHTLWALTFWVGMEVRVETRVKVRVEMRVEMRRAEVRRAEGDFF